MIAGKGVGLILVLSGESLWIAGHARNDSGFALMSRYRTIGGRLQLICIVPMLADEGIYLASESSFSRVLRAHGQTARRGRAKTPKAVRPPTTHIAGGPSQVWCWGMAPHHTDSMN